MSQRKHIHPAPVSAGRQIATALRRWPASGFFSLPPLPPITMSASMMAMYIGANYNNDGATGGNSIAIGVSAGATGIGTSAIGASASATGGSSIGVGTSAEATGKCSSIAIGQRTKATENGATALGRQSAATGGASYTAIGSGAQASATKCHRFGWWC